MGQFHLYPLEFMVHQLQVMHLPKFTAHQIQFRRQLKFTVRQMLFRHQPKYMDHQIHWVQLRLAAVAHLGVDHQMEFLHRPIFYHQVSFHQIHFMDHLVKAHSNHNSEAHQVSAKFFLGIDRIRIHYGTQSIF